MMAWWQNIYGYIDPIAFKVGFFSVHWYALFWLFGFISVWFAAKRLRLKNLGVLTEKEWGDVLLFLFIGALLGGHIGYGLLYQPLNFFYYPLQFFSPYSFETGNWIGIRGMSFYGGLIGVGIALGFQARKYQKDFLVLADFVSLLAPVALFFGRLGNFFNHELPGRITVVPWGIHIPVLSHEAIPFMETLRHPSALYEAFGEGVILFVLLLSISRKTSQPGQLTAFFLVGYGTFRFFLEYFRELDLGTNFIFEYFTFGQILSLITALSGALFLLWLRKKRRVTISV